MNELYDIVPYAGLNNVIDTSSIDVKEFFCVFATIGYKTGQMDDMGMARYGVQDIFPINDIAFCDM